MLKILSYIKTFFLFCVLSWIILLTMSMFENTGYSRSFISVFRGLANPFGDTGVIFSYIPALVATVAFYRNFNQGFILSILLYTSIVCYVLFATSGSERGYIIFGVPIFVLLTFIGSVAGASTRLLYNKYFLNR